MKRPGQCTTEVTKTLIEIAEICGVYMVQTRQKYDLC